MYTENGLNSLNVGNIETYKKVWVERRGEKDPEVSMCTIYKTISRCPETPRKIRKSQIIKTTKMTY